MEIFYSNEIKNVQEKIHSVIEAYPDGKIQYEEIKGRDTFSIGKLNSLKLSTFIYKGHIRYEEIENGIKAKFDLQDRFSKTMSWAMFTLTLLLIVFETNATFQLIGSSQIDGSLSTFEKFFLYFGILFALSLGLITIIVTKYTSKKGKELFYKSLQPDILELNFSITKFSMRYLIILFLGLLGTSILYFVIGLSVAMRLIG